MNRLIIERLTGKTVHGYATWAMREGIEREPEARLAYMFHADVDVADAWVYPHPTIAGAHASPDGFVGDDGLVQFKCPQHPAHLDLLEGGATPPGYVMQVHVGDGLHRAGVVRFRQLPARLSRSCQRRSDFASAGRSNIASVLNA